MNEPTGLMIRQITILAHSLPKEIELDQNGSPVLIRVAREGKSLIREGKSEINGERIRKGKQYQVYEYVYVSHYKSLLQAYKEKGQAGVDEYVRTKKMSAWNSFSRKKKIGFILKAAVRKIKESISQIKFLSRLK